MKTIERAIFDWDSKELIDVSTFEEELEANTRATIEALDRNWEVGLKTAVSPMSGGRQVIDKQDVLNKLWLEECDDPMLSSVTEVCTTSPLDECCKQKDVIDTVDLEELERSMDNYNKVITKEETKKKKKTCKRREKHHALKSRYKEKKYGFLSRLGATLKDGPGEEILAFGKKRTCGSKVSDDSVVIKEVINGEDKNVESLHTEKIRL